MILLEDCITDEALVSVVRQRNDAIGESHCGKLVFVKAFDANEFIGQAVAQTKGVRTVKYFLVKFGDKPEVLHFGDLGDCDIDKIMIGSYDFRRKNCQYYDINEFGLHDEILESMLELCNDERNRRQLLGETLEMMGLDTYIGNEDRRSYNIKYEVDQFGNVHLGSCYDYELSFDNDTDFEIYPNIFHNLNSLEDYRNFIKQYPQFGQILSGYVGYDLISQIKRCFKRRRLSLDRCDLSSYENFAANKQKQLVKILK